MTFEPVWGPIIAAYLFLAGVGGGAFVTSVVVGSKHPDAQMIRRIGRLVAPIVVIIGLLLLMVDAKAGFQNPLRFALLLSNPGSVMTWGVVFLAVFTLVSLVVALLDLLKKAVPRWLEIVGVVFAIAVAMYTGCLLGVCKTFPLWNNALLPILFLVSAMSTGAAATFLLGALIAPKEFNECGAAKKMHYYLPVIEIALVAALLFVTASVNETAANSVANLVSGKYAVAFWLGFAAFGLVIPAAIETKLTFFSSEAFESGAAGKGLAVLANSGVLVGGFLLRLLIVIAALPVTMVTPMLL